MADFSTSVRCLIQVNIARQRKRNSLLPSKIEPTQAVAPAEKENPGLSSACCGPTVHLVSLYFLETPVCALIARGDFSFGFLFPIGSDSVSHARIASWDAGIRPNTAHAHDRL